MPIIKLDAIDSTNDYLKQLAREQEAENYTLVIAREQTKGRGQMGAKWISEPGKNLTMSLLFRDLRLQSDTFFDLNVAVALGVMEVLEGMSIPNLKIKWPNDIMADNKKLGGILIENMLKPGGKLDAVIGLGLNVNQTNFEELPQATSLACITRDETHVIDKLALLVSDAIKAKLSALETDHKLLWQEYQQALFKHNYPSAFEDQNGKRFMGIIQGITPNGKLVVLLEDDQTNSYDIKEVKLLF